MMINRISTKGNQIIIEQDGQITHLSETELTDLASRNANIGQVLEAKMGRKLHLPLFFHVNRNGRIVIAYQKNGLPPSVWPEDELQETEKERQARLSAPKIFVPSKPRLRR